MGIISTMKFLLSALSVLLIFQHSLGCLFWVVTVGTGRSDMIEGNERTQDQEAIMAMELQAFDQCESDGATGLSWEEAESCEEKFCSLLAIECPLRKNSIILTSTEMAFSLLRNMFQQLDIKK